MLIRIDIFAIRLHIPGMKILLCNDDGIHARGIAGLHRAISHLGDLHVVAPDTMNSGFTTTIVRSAGQMTLYMEIYDSATSKLIARVIDPEAADNGLAQRANRVTNKVAADQIIGRWAELLVKRLDEAKEHTTK